MAARPGYYLSSPGSVILFPIYPRWGGEFGQERSDLVHETRRGKRYVYTQFARTKITVPFRFTQTDYAAFLAFHTAVGGQTTAFYYVPDTSVMGTVYYVRKEKDFLPRPLDIPAVINGSRLAVWDYTLELTTEPSDAEVDA